MRRLILLTMALLLGVFLTHSLWAQEDEYPEEPIIFDQPVKGVIFDHKSHVEDFGLSCDSCHDGIFEMAAGTAAENGDFTMESMYKGKYCGACHDGETAFAANTRCAKCHIGVLGVQRLLGQPEKKEEKGHH
jgi:c(7)-type cytochrome triheme protein